jgi:basic membrane protein A and related proteins
MRILSRLASLVTALLAIAIVAMAPSAATAADTRAVLLLTQPLSPFEEEVWASMEKAKADGIATEVKLIEMKNPTEYEQTIRQVAEQGYNVIVSTYFFVKEAYDKLAPEYPESHFVLLYEPNDKNIPNMRGVAYDVQEGSYVCGVVAGLMTKSNRIGFIGGNDSPSILKFFAGLEAGAKSVNPNVAFDLAFIDPDKGQELAISLFDRGDDVVMHAANMTGLGMFSAAKDAGKYTVGVDIDQNSLAPDSVICSALANPGLSVYASIKDVHEGTWTGGNVDWGIDDGAPAAALASWLPDDVKKAAAEAEAKIVSGEVKVPVETATR